MLVLSSHVQKLDLLVDYATEKSLNNGQMWQTEYAAKNRI